MYFPDILSKKTVDKGVPLKEGRKGNMKESDL